MKARTPAAAKTPVAKAPAYKVLDKDTAPRDIAYAIPRYDGVMIITVQNGNPNGDPDNEGAPRQNPYTRRGEISPASIKRKARDGMLLRRRNEQGYDIFVQRDAALEDAKKSVIDQAEAAADNKEDAPRLAHEMMLDRFADVRMFGAVLAANKNTKIDNVRAAISIFWGESVEAIDILDPTGTRMSSEKDRAADNKENKGMYQSHIVPFGVYLVPFHINPFEARKNRLRPEDVEYFKTYGLPEIYENGNSTMRGDVGVHAIYAFRHDNVYGAPGVGRSELVRNAVQVRRATQGAAASLDDYEIKVATQDQLPKGVTLEVWKEPYKLNLFG